VVKLYVHRLCLSSYTLYKELKARGTLDKVKFIDTSNSLKAVKKGVFSVPALETQGRLIAVDPIEVELVEAAALNEDLSRFAPKTVEEAVEAFFKSLYASGYLSCVSLIHGLKPILKDLSAVRLLAKLRLGTTLKTSEVTEGILKKMETSKDEVRSKLAYICFKNYVREHIWLNPKANYEDILNILNESNVTSWLLAKTSLGRTLIPNNLNTVKKAANELIKLGNNKLETTTAKTKEEVETLSKDIEFQKYIKTKGSS